MAEASWAWPDPAQLEDDTAEPADAVSSNPTFEPDAELRALIAGKEEAK